LVDVQVIRKTRNLSLPELRAHPALEDLTILKNGNFSCFWLPAA